MSWISGLAVWVSQSAAAGLVEDRRPAGSLARRVKARKTPEPQNRHKIDRTLVTEPSNQARPSPEPSPEPGPEPNPLLRLRTLECMRVKKNQRDSPLLGSGTSVLKVPYLISSHLRGYVWEVNQNQNIFAQVEDSWMHEGKSKPEGLPLARIQNLGLRDTCTRVSLNQIHISSLNHSRPLHA